MIDLSINLDKVNKELIFEGAKGHYLNIKIDEMRNPKYDNTHYAYQYNKETKEKTYVAYGKIFKFKKDNVEKDGDWDNAIKGLDKQAEDSLTNSSDHENEGNEGNGGSDLPF